ncbi:MAG: acetylglutamate kinase [Nitrospinota bacterium]|nr:acetylglutamate kinase [Nitrospinota bacterium]
MSHNPEIDTLVAKAATLVEALPYIRAFKGKTLVIKYGGGAMVDDTLKNSFAKDVVLLKHIGINPVVVHGGGPQIGQTLEKMGIQTTFIHGQRVTDQQTLDVVEMVLAGKVNKEIVALINRNGGSALGLSGKDGDMIHAEKLFVEKPGPELDRPEIIDVGMVGKVTSINSSILDHISSGGFIPVIAPVGYGRGGETYNINADYVAGAIAGAIGAEKLLLLTDEAGILDGDKKLISTVTEDCAKDLIGRGIIRGGMVPKVKACFTALEAGVAKAHIVDGRVVHSVLLEIFTDTGVGTEIKQ